MNSNEFDDVLTGFKEVANELSTPLISSNTVSPHGDQWAFVQEDVQGVIVSSTNQNESGRGWGHTHADTLDKIDVRDLREHAVTISNVVCALTEADRGDIPSLTRRNRNLVDDGYDQELKLGGRWPY